VGNSVRVELFQADNDVMKRSERPSQIKRAEFSNLFACVTFSELEDDVAHGQRVSWQQIFSRVEERRDPAQSLLFAQVESISFEIERSGLLLNRSREVWSCGELPKIQCLEKCSLR